MNVVSNPVNLGTRATHRNWNEKSKSSSAVTSRKWCVKAIPAVAGICIVLNFWGKHKRKVVIRGILTGIQESNQPKLL